MTNALRGRVLSRAFAHTMLAGVPGVVPLPPDVDALLERLGDSSESTLGPASGARQVTDCVAIPLIRSLGLRIGHRRDSPAQVRLDLSGSGGGTVPLLVRAWTDELDEVWPDVVHACIAAESRWGLAINGRALRVIDAHHTWSREHLEIAVPALGHDHDARRILWALTNEAALTAVPALLDSVAHLSTAHGIDVSRNLGRSVVRSLRELFVAFQTVAPGTIQPPRLLEQSLTVVYRILFLLFAEARGLVPVWHPVYCDSYTVGAIVTTLMCGRMNHDTWRTVQTISRMAHAGCIAGSLSVTAFNGKLFSPRQTAGIDTRRIPDRVMNSVVLGLGTTGQAGSGITRTRFDDLDVEHLGAIYEHVLEYQPGSAAADPLVRTRDARKATGTFYTPRRLAASLVEQTLAPLVKDRSAADILRLRILDPAMGSGAFLVAACRYLAARVEEALVAEGTWHPGEATDTERAALRRDVIQRCLYGVDLNPVAVQLARLSLWLVGLAHDKPLSFLDHRLVVGNSLVGASPADIHRPTGGARTVGHPPRHLPLFDEAALDATMNAAIGVRQALALEPDDTSQTVRSKEERLASLSRSDSSLSAWKRVLDFWCATWFWDDGQPPDRATLRDVTARLVGAHPSLRASTVDALLARASGRADEHRFLHWPLVFPEVFAADAHPRGPGFDAIVGNPPWDMVRGDAGDDSVRGVRRIDARQLTRFVRHAGIYRTVPHAHVNRYALFVERTLQLLRSQGRIGLVVPAGAFSDASAAPLRSHLFGSASVDAIVGLDNRARIFPIHRSTKFVLFTATGGEPTRVVRCSFGVSRLANVDAAWSSQGALVVTRPLLERLSGANDMALPDLASAADLRILEKISAQVPTLGSSAGWGARFGRELNASDDSAQMQPRSGSSARRAVVEGKVLTPFHVHLDKCRFELTEAAQRRTQIPRRHRLGYREVASATNRLTLIAAIVPDHAVTLHTVLCLKSAHSLDEQYVLCGLLNSFVANYLVRMRVGTHVTAAVMAALRVPCLQPATSPFARILRHVMALTQAKPPIDEHQSFADLQADVAHLYQLTAPDFAHILSTFPLIAASVRESSLLRFSATRSA